MIPDSKNQNDDVDNSSIDQIKTIKADEGFWLKANENNFVGTCNLMKDNKTDLDTK